MSRSNISRTASGVATSITRALSGRNVLLHDDLQSQQYAPMLATHQSAYEEWREVCAAIHKEMDEIVVAGRAGARDAWEDRRQRFLELIAKRRMADRAILPAKSRPQRIEIENDKAAK